MWEFENLKEARKEEERRVQNGTREWDIGNVAFNNILSFNSKIPKWCRFILI